jgi:hypothetical protein
VSADLRAAVRAALDVETPRVSFDRILSRARGQRLESLRSRTRSVLAAGTLLVVAALFAGVNGAVDPTSVHLASAPLPAPVPLST